MKFLALSKNGKPAARGQKTSYERFLRLTNMLDAMEERDHLEISFDPDKKGGHLARVQMIYADEREADEIERLLGIKPKRFRSADGRQGAAFRLVAVRDFSRALKGDGDLPDVAIRLHSFIGALHYLAIGVQVPDIDIEQGRAYIPKAPDGTPYYLQPNIKLLMNVRCSSTCPPDAFTCIPYRGKFFYIDDSDIDSKGSLLFLITLFSLQFDVKAVHPLLTIPVGR